MYLKYLKFLLIPIALYLFISMLIAIFFCLCEYCYTVSGVYGFCCRFPVCIVYMFVSGCLC